MRTIYCDESGYTGNRLLDDQQPYFAFSAVRIAPEESSQYVNEVCSRFNVQSQELKFGRLRRTNRGQEAIKKVITDLSSQTLVAVFDKKYALAGKMFEYLIEPAVSDISRFLYDINFHKFVASGLYAQMVCAKGSAEEAFSRFQQALCDRTESSVIAVTDAFDSLAVETFVDKVLTFVTCNRKYISDEVVSEFTDPSNRWMLELSQTSLQCLLASHGEDMHPLEVFYDPSKPLSDHVPYFDVMIGRTEQRHVEFAGQRHQLIFNLSRSIEPAESTATPGIQLADIFAGISAYALTNRDNELSSFWYEASEGFVSENSVLPDLERYAPTNQEGIVNHYIFEELLRCALSGENYSESLPEFIPHAQSYVEANLPELLAHSERSE